jgi:hypothetical protein
MDGLIAMLKRLLLALALVIPAWITAHADTAIVVATCGTPPTTYVAGQAFAITQDTTGALCSSGSGGGGGGASAKATAADPTYVEGTLNPLSLNLSGYQRVILPTSQLIATGTAGTPSSQVLSVQGIPSMTPVSVNLTAAPTGGGTPYTFITTASTNSQAIKSSAAGTLTDIQAFNTTTTISFLRLYDSPSAPNCSSATGFVNSYPIPPATAAGLVGGFAIPLGALGKAFVNGIGYCVTGGGTSTDNSPGQAGIYINADYK